MTGLSHILAIPVKANMPLNETETQSGFQKSKETRSFECKRAVNCSTLQFTITTLHNEGNHLLCR